MITWLEEKLGLPYQTWHKGQDIGVRLLTQVLKEVVETNSLIQAAKDRARGFRSTKILVDFPVRDAIDRQLQISITII
jgi:hypothetical protein